MNKNEPTVIPMNSHFVKFDPPKMGVVEGFVEEVHGMLLSDYYIFESGLKTFETVRTILVGDELSPNWHIDSGQDSIDIHFLKDYPKLTLSDIKRCMQLARQNRSISEMFEDMERYGCTTEFEGKLIEVTVDCDNNNYYFHIPGLGNYPKEKNWPPAVLGILYSLQSFMKCRFHLSSKELDEASLELMNELLENHSKHGIKAAKYGNNGIVYNDGVYTYYKYGAKKAMSREEFLSKFEDFFYIDD